MSRVGKKLIEIPQGVTAKIEAGKVVIIGPKGTLEQKFRSELNCTLKDNKIAVERKADDLLSKSLHGLTRTLIANMIEGVTKGFYKTLEIQGTGYRASMEGENLKIIVGFSHPVIVKPPAGIKFQVEGTAIIKILGADKQLVGQMAAAIRNVKKVEPYKGKGIRYQGEKVRRKAGKAAKAGAAAGA